jgi:hypothetical protein
MRQPWRPAPSLRQQARPIYGRIPRPPNCRTAVRSTWFITHTHPVLCAPHSVLWHSPRVRRAGDVVVVAPLPARAPALATWSSVHARRNLSGYELERAQVGDDCGHDGYCRLLPSAFGRPMDWPRAQRASRAAVRRRVLAPVPTQRGWLERLSPSAPWRWRCQCPPAGTATQSHVRQARE